MENIRRLVKPLPPTLCLEAEASCFNDLSISTGVSSGATNPTKCSNKRKLFTRLFAR